MIQEWSQTQKDSLLRKLLQHLSARGIAGKWATSEKPYSDIQRECRALMGNQDFVKDISGYLKLNPIIQQTVETLLAHLAMASGVRWQDVAPVLQPLAKRGWYLGRWVPTFLVVDGPLGRVLKTPESPINSVLRKESNHYPMLCQVRDLFNTDFFRQVRNGVGHWSFLWDDKDSNPQIVVIDWQDGKQTTTISLMEGEALHLAAFSVIEVLDLEIFSRANPRSERN